MNKENLKKLADYLAKLPEDYQQFEMSNFIDEATFDEAVEYIRKDGNMCGTSACAIGHAPHAGITLDFTQEELDRMYVGTVGGGSADLWTAYAQRAFGIDFNTPQGEWMFGGEWAGVDNTPRGAAARIKFILAGNEVPKAFGDDSFDMLWGEADENSQEICLNAYTEYL